MRASRQEMRARWRFMGSSSQEAEIVVVLHLADEAREHPDRARGVVEIDRLVRRVRVASRHPDADRGDAVATQVDRRGLRRAARQMRGQLDRHPLALGGAQEIPLHRRMDRKSTRLNSSHRTISYAVFCLKKKMSLRAET